MKLSECCQKVCRCFEHKKAGKKIELIRFVCNLNLLKNNQNKIQEEKRGKSKQNGRRGKKKKTPQSFQIVRIQSFEMATRSLYVRPNNNYSLFLHWKRKVISSRGLSVPPCWPTETTAVLLMISIIVSPETPELRTKENIEVFSYRRFASLLHNDQLFEKTRV